MKNEITYTQINGINYPNLALPEQPEVNIGKYGQMANQMDTHIQASGHQMIHITGMLRLADMQANKVNTANMHGIMAK